MDRRGFVGMMGAGLVSGVICGRAGASAAVPQVRLILCVLGPGEWLPQAARCVEDFGRGFHMDREYSVAQSDDRMPDSFAVSWNQVPPTYATSDLSAVERHRSVAYVLSNGLRQSTAMAAAADAIELIDTLFAAGALACKCETGGVANGVEHWRSSADRLRAADPDERMWILYRAFVRRPLDDDGVLYTAGMHSLGLPDIEYVGLSDLVAATARIDAIARSVLDGAVRDLTVAPCTRYTTEEFLYNPYGVLRIDERRAGRERSERLGSTRPDRTQVLLRRLAGL